MDIFRTAATHSDLLDPGAANSDRENSVYMMKATTTAHGHQISRRGVVGAIISVAVGMGVVLSGGPAYAATYETKPACSA